MATEKKLDCVILGLLNHEELTGYEIKKRMDKALRGPVYAVPADAGYRAVSCQVP